MIPRFAAAMVLAAVVEAAAGAVPVFPRMLVFVAKQVAQPTEFSARRRRHKRPRTRVHRRNPAKVAAQPGKRHSGPLWRFNGPPDDAPLIGRTLARYRATVHPTPLAWDYSGEVVGGFAPGRAVVFRAVADKGAWEPAAPAAPQVFAEEPELSFAVQEARTSPPPRRMSRWAWRVAAAAAALSALLGLLLYSFALLVVLSPSFRCWLDQRALRR